MLALSAALAPLLAVKAHSAEVTDLPPELGLVGRLSYGGSSLSGKLLEEGQQVARRRITRHDLALGAELAPLPWVSFSLELGLTPSLRYRYPEAREMIIEPLTGSGSYLAGEPSLETPTVAASGISGLWLGIAANPLLAAGPSGDARSAWRLDAAVRTPSKKRNLWTAPSRSKGGGSRGVAPGGTAFRLAGAFSRKLGIAEPWMRAVWVTENKVEVDIVDEQGNAWASDLPLQPASTVDLDFGGQFLAFSAAETGTKVAVNTWLGGGYRTWEDVASGVYLPNVLDGARRIPVTAGDSLEARAGLEVDVDVNEALALKTGAVVSWFLPFRPEHVYEVRTSPDTMRVGFTLTVEGRKTLSLGEP